MSKLTETKKLRLMQNVINDEPLSEANFIKTALHKLASTIAPSKPQQSQQPQQNQQDQDTSFETGDANTRDIYTIVSQLAHPASGTVRYVLSMNFQDLKHFYLKEGGGADTAELILNNSSDKQNAFFNLSQSTQLVGRFVKLDGSKVSLARSFNTMPKLNMMVLLNIPKQLSDEFKKSISDEKAKEAFIKMMSHKYYVGTINRDRMSFSNAKMFDGKSDEELIKFFNPRWLEHWRVNQIRIRAVNEWDNVNSDQAKNKKDAEDSEQRIAKMERQKREKEAQSNLDTSSMTKNEAAIKNIISSAADKDKMIDTLNGSINSGKFTREEVIKILTNMNTMLQSPVLQQVLDKMNLNQNNRLNRINRPNRPNRNP